MRKITGPTILLFCILSSCGIYRPSTPLPTTFENRGDFSASSSLSFSTAHVNLAYSPIKYFFIHGDAGVSGGFKPIYSGGAGLYYPISNKFQIEAQYATGGKAEFDWGDPFNGISDAFTSASGDYSQWNSTVTLNYKVNEVFRMGLAYRYSDIDLHYKDSNLDWIKNSSYSLFQNGFHLILMKDHTNKKVHFFITTGFEFNNADFDHYPYNRVIYNRAGIVYRLRK